MVMFLSFLLFYQWYYDMCWERQSKQRGKLKQAQMIRYWVYLEIAGELQPRTHQATHESIEGLRQVVFAASSLKMGKYSWWMFIGQETGLGKLVFPFFLSLIFLVGGHAWESSFQILPFHSRLKSYIKGYILKYLQAKILNDWYFL